MRIRICLIVSVGGHDHEVTNRSVYFLCQISTISFPNCTNTTLDWSFNSAGQNPCAVAAYLESTCWQGSFTVPPLPSGYEYTGPNGTTADDNDLCKCNTVTYSLISACGACQGEPWVTWSEWVTNCTTILSPSTFPNPVPNGTFVPYWSTLDVTVENTWDMNSSMTAGDLPEIGPGQVIGNSSTPSSPPSSFIASTTPAPTDPGPTSSLLL